MTPNSPDNSMLAVRKPRRLVAVLAMAALVAIVGSRASTQAQIVSPVQVSEPAAAPAKEEPKQTLEQWRKDVAERMAAAEAQAHEAKQAEQEPSPSLKRRLEHLSRIDLILSQTADERESAKKLQEKTTKLKADLEQLVQDGLNDDASVSLRELDQVRAALRTEKRRLDRNLEKEKAATAAFEKAQEVLQEKSAARRLAKEKVDDNKDAQQRQSLGEQLAEFVEQSELAKAELGLRRQEMLNAKAAKESKEVEVRTLQEKEARIDAVVVFGTNELQELFEELDQREDELKKRIETFERAAEPRIRYVEEQWMSSRRKFDTTEGEKPALRAQIRAFELEFRVLKEVAPLLRLQLDLLSKDRQAWRYRQRIFNSDPDRKTVLKWTEESNDALAQIKREERKTLFELDELREQIEAVEERQKSAENGSLESEAVEKQLASLRSLIDNQQESLGSIRGSLRLHETLLGELEGDSLAKTARDKLHSLWDGVQSIWNYELTSFGDGDSERSVTVQKVVTALLILFAGVIFSKALSRAVGRQVLRRLDIDPSASATIQSLFYYVLLLMFGLFALNVAKVPLTAFTVLGGAVALGIGFGSQNIINNFISGLILLAERPVKVGDLIQLEGGPNGEQLYGNIEHIGARSARVRTGANLEIIVPNSSFLQNNVINFTLSSDKLRTMVEVGVVYGSPTVTVTQLLRRAVIETGRVAKDPPPIILFKNFGDNSLVFEVHFWIRMRTVMDKLQIESAVRFRIDQLFREEGIVIAFPQRDVHIDSVSPLEVRITPPDSPSATGGRPLT